jgi:hypothetical protein
MTTAWATNGPIGMYEYNFGDSPFPVFTTATSVQHAYQTAGLHTVQLSQGSGGGGGVSGTSKASTVVGAGYTPVTPTRILDTRKGTGTGKAAAVPANGTLTLSLPGVGGTPADAMTAVVMNVTVAGTQKAGVLTVFPGAGTTPNVSNLNFASRQVVSNLVTVQVSDGEVSFHNSSGGTIQVIADLAGYYGAAGNGYQPQTPLRVLDTRYGTGAQRHGHAAAQRRLAGRHPGLVDRSGHVQPQLQFRPDPGQPGHRATQQWSRGLLQRLAWHPSGSSGPRRLLCADGTGFLRPLRTATIG